MSADITEERIAERLGFLADELRSWLKYNEKGHGKTDEELSGDIHVMLSNGYTDAPPCWPSRSVLKHWIGTLDAALSQLAALQSVPQGVEAPELDGGANPYQRNIENPGSFGWSLNRAFREGYDAARSRTRLVPTPPQASVWPSQEPLRIPVGTKVEFRTADGTLETAVCTASSQPLQPEARRVGPDEVVVGRGHLREALDCIEYRVDEIHYRRSWFDALRTSAQDHNETEKEST